MNANAPEKELDALALGQTLKFTAPSGYQFEIREQNGSDDDILSNQGAAKDGKNFNNFIQAIVIWTDFTPNHKLTYEDVLGLKLRDKYTILFKSRIHSLGEIVKFSFDWGKDGKHEYSEDLTRYMWDYSRPVTEFPLDATFEDYFSERIKPYVEGKKDTVEVTLKSGKVIKFDYLNGHSEKYLLSLPTEQRSKNTEFKARNLKLMVGPEWIKVENFKFFTTKDMMELRTLTKMLDPEFNAFSEITNPVTNESMDYPIVGASAFFYPTEI